MSYQGRNVVVLGLGLTGYSLARHLAAHGATVRVADTRPAPPFAAKLAAALPNVRVATGPFTTATFAGVDLIAISPGVAKDQPAIAAAVARGAELSPPGPSQPDFAAIGPALNVTRAATPIDEVRQALRTALHAAPVEDEARSVLEELAVAATSRTV